MSRSDWMQKWSGYAIYWSMAALYLLFVLVLKITEWCLMPDIDGVNMGNILVRGITYNMIIASWIVLAGALLYYPLHKWCTRSIFYITVAWFSLLIIIELSLAIYVGHNGYMLDSELWARPLKESFMSVKGAVGLYMPVMTIIGVVLTLLFFGTWLVHHAHKAVWSVLPVSVIFVLLSLLFQMNHLMEYKAFAYIHNRTYFLAEESVKYFKNAVKSGDICEGTYQIAYDETLINEFLKDYPQWQVLNKQYPLERTDNTPDVLSPYFNNATQKPDVVLLLVESLGDELISNGFTPFIDSLARTGLCWDNCLSTAIRSFAALPAITGSVNGPRGFQFGTMPEFNSLVAIFNQNNYATRHFYAGYLTFDCIYEYLSAQHVSSMAPFFKYFKDHNERRLGTYWGYNDGVLLNKITDSLKQSSGPHFSMITTITMHESLEIANDAEKQHYYERKADANAYVKNFNTPGRAAAALYTDDCLRQWMQQYAKLPNYNNTIFIIVGDHASGMQTGDPLSYHHVPLIIWSPLIKEAHTFHSVVTHYDIAPSLCALMKNKYQLDMPSTVHWWGEGLDTSSAMHANRNMLIVGYNRDLRCMLYQNYYYQAANDWEGEQLYAMDEYMHLTPVNDDNMLRLCRKKLQTYKYMLCYTYYNNKLTSHPIYSRQCYTNVITYKRSKDVAYVTPMDKPSEKGDKIYDIFEEMSLPPAYGNNRVKLTFVADVLIQDSVWQDNYPFLVVDFKGDDEVWECDYISKFLNAEILHKDSTYHLEMSKEFELSHTSANLCSVHLLSPGSDHHWKPGTRITIKNAALKVNYAK